MSFQILQRAYAPYGTAAQFPASGDSRLIYRATDTGYLYTWDASESAYKLAGIDPATAVSTHNTAPDAHADIRTALAGKQDAGSFAGSSTPGGAATTALECTGNAATATTAADSSKLGGQLPSAFASASHTHSGYETAMGSPSVDGYLLSSTSAGVRSWVAPYSHPATHAQSVIDSSSGWITTALAGKQAAGSYLTTTGTAADSEKLGGVAASGYSQADHTHNSPDWSDIENVPQVLNDFSDDGTGLKYKGADIGTIDAIISAIYPVGSIYMSVNNVNPGTYLLGTTWVAWGSGRVPVGVDTTQTEFDTVEETGGTKFTSYTPAGSNTGTAVTMSAITLTHSGGAVSNHKLVESELPKISGSWSIHDQENGTVFYGYNGHCTGTTLSNKYKSYITTVTGAYSLQNPGFSFGGDGSHNHGFTQPSQHSFTPTTKSVTNPTFTGTAANISTVQPYITCYMWKRTA